MKPELYRKWRPSASLDLLTRTAHGRRPSDDEFDAAHTDPEKVALLKSAADRIQATRERNVGMRGLPDAVKEAQEASLAFVALRDPPAPVNRLSPEEADALDAVAERIAGNPANRGIAG